VDAGSGQDIDIVVLWRSRQDEGMKQDSPNEGIGFILKPGQD